MRILFATLALALLVGCGTPAESSDSVASAAPTLVNAQCPMMGGEVDPAVPAVDWNGHQVGFCCAGCGGKFSALSDEQKLAKLKEHGADV